MRNGLILVAMASKGQTREGISVAPSKGVSKSRAGVWPTKVAPGPQQGTSGSRAKGRMALRPMIVAQTEIFRRAAEVIGSEDGAMRWMGTPVAALEYATPVSLLHSESGVEKVRTVLGRLEHGVL